MIQWIITHSLKNRILVLAAVFIAVFLGINAMKSTPVDAIPDLSDIQVIVYTPYAGQAPQVVEDQLTYPLTTAMMSVPDTKNVRGFSFFGYSLVYVIFEEGTDLYWARSRVMEQLNSISGDLPAGASPRLGPDASGVGWAFIYSLSSEKHDIAQLRSIQDWYLKYDLMSVDGVAQVAAGGGFINQYQIEIDPEKMRLHGITLRDIRSAVRQSNKDVGGRIIEQGETEFMVHSSAYLRSVEDIRSIPVSFDSETGAPLLLSQIAHVHRGPEIRRGVMEMNGNGEVVSGIVIVRHGENALKVIDNVKKRLEALKKGLPEGVTVHTSYDRSSLIRRAIDTLKTTLAKELLIVALLCIIFLLHIRSALIAVFVVPAGIIISFIIMNIMNITANIMSLSGIAIAIGVMIDAAIVMVENLHKHKENNPHASHFSQVSAAATEVGPALFFSLLIVTVSFMPIFSLQQQEGRLFTPLAYTKTLAMGISSLLAITVIPVLMYYFVRGKTIPERKNPLNRIITALYLPCIRLVLRFPKITILLALIIVSVTWIPLSQTGSEFMPPLNEGDLLYMPTTPPGISITKAKELLQQTDRIIARHPQVKHVLGKAGRADTATDPAPLSMLETHIILTPETTWPAGKTMENIINELDEMVQFPGLTNSWTMPIKTRIDMLTTGIKTPVGIKLLGDDLTTLSRTGKEIEALLRSMPEASSVFSERVTGGRYITIRPDRKKAAGYGLRMSHIQNVIRTALGGMNITTTVEGLERYPVNIRYARDFRSSLEDIRRLPIQAPSGQELLLEEVASVSVEEGPPAIKSENARRTAWIYVDTRESDIGGFVNRAKKKVSDSITLPPGVSLVWSGQYEYMERAEKRMRIIIPVTIGIIFLLLLIHFSSVTESLIVMLTLPFAMVGGVWLLYMLDYNFSVAVIVGFLALAGLAAETGVIMMVYLDENYKKMCRSRDAISLSDIRQVIIEGAVMRVRPKIMTVATDLFAIVPIMFINETGSRIMKRIAAPMVGGIFTSAILTLLIIPAFYMLWKKTESSRHMSDQQQAKRSQS